MSNNTKKLAGKIAVITGGSSGIGLAAAQRFVNEGAHVFITGLIPEPKPFSMGIAAPKGRLSPAAEKFWQCAKEAAAR